MSLGNWVPRAAVTAPAQCLIGAQVLVECLSGERTAGGGRFADSKNGDPWDEEGYIFSY